MKLIKLFIALVSALLMLGALLNEIAADFANDPTKQQQVIGGFEAAVAWVHSLGLNSRYTFGMAGAAVVLIILYFRLK